MENSYLRWQETGREEGISIPWQNITLHAISSEPVKCIYIMLDNHVDYPTNLANGNGHNGERMANDPNDDDDDEGTCEGNFHCDDSFLFSSKKNIYHLMKSGYFFSICRRRAANDRNLVYGT